MKHKQPAWTQYLGQIDCDTFSIRVYRPFPVLRWLFLDYWRFRLPSRNLLESLWVVRSWRFRLKGLFWAIWHGWRQSSGFITTDVFIAEKMPSDVMVSDDGGCTWTTYSENGDDAEDEPRRIVGVPEWAK